MAAVVVRAAGGGGAERAGGEGCWAEGEVAEGAGCAGQGRHGCCVGRGGNGWDLAAVGCVACAGGVLRSVAFDLDGLLCGEWEGDERSEVRFDMTERDAEVAPGSRWRRESRAKSCE